MDPDSKRMTASSPLGAAGLCCIGINHKTTPVALREALYVSQEALRIQLPLVKDTYGFSEVLALSTCNRLELYGVRPPPFHTVSLFEAYASLQNRTLDLEPLQAHSYVFLEEEAVAHLFRVVASLDSLVVGETQITGQFKEAVTLAAEVSTLGPVLQWVSQEALHIHKQIRSHTEIGAHTLSISHAAVQLAQRVFKDLSTHPILLLGAGEMIRIAAQYLLRFRPCALRVANRNLPRAEGLVSELGFGSAHPWEQLPALLAEADIVITSTAAPEPILGLELLQQILRQRKGRSLFIVDIAVPRDVDPRCGSLPNLYLFDLDDLQQAAQRATEWIDAGIMRYQRWRQEKQTKPGLGHFHNYLHGLLQRELGRTLQHKAFHSLEPTQRLSLEHMHISVANKLTGDLARILTGTEDSLFRTHIQELLFQLPATEGHALHLSVAKEAELVDLPSLPEETSAP
jgi:glutamyl-tRNA reductase